MKYNIYTEEINPFVRFVCKRNVAIPTKLSFAKDMRLFYFLDDGGTINVDNESIKLCKNDVLFISPMAGYFFESAHKNYNYYIINFDFLMNNCNVKSPIPTCTDRESAPLQEISFLDLEEFGKSFKVNMPDMETYFSKMADLFSNGKMFSKTQCNAYMTLTLSKIFENYFSLCDKGTLFEIITYIKSNCEKNLSNKKIGEHFSYHPNYINRLFVECLGVSLHRFVINCRIERAIILLNTTDLTLEKIAEKTGWSSAGYFSKAFYEITGYKPNKYRVG